MEKVKQIHEIHARPQPGVIHNIWHVYGDLESFIEYNVQENRFVRRRMKDGSDAIYVGEVRLHFRRMEQETLSSYWIKRYNNILANTATRFHEMYWDKNFAEFQAQARESRELAY